MHKNKNWLITGSIALILFLGLTLTVYVDPLWLTVFDSKIQELVLPLVDTTRTQILSTLVFFLAARALIFY